MRKRKVNTLKTSYVVSAVVGLFVGFQRHKRVADGYARCLMCKANISFAGRGLGDFLGHWKGADHTLLEEKFRIMTQRPLLDRSCRPVSADEDRRIRLERMVEPPVYLESEIGLTVEERLAIEGAALASDTRLELPAESSSYLWLMQFRNAFASVTYVSWCN